MKNTLILVTLLLIVSCAGGREAGISKVSYKELPGWFSDNHAGALASFSKSCDIIKLRPININQALFGGNYASWQYVCSKISSVVNARDFFEDNFTPYLVSSKNNKKTLFTGYFEIELNGSKKKKAPYLYPIYKTPDSQNLEAKNYSRTQIDEGALQGKNLEIAWVDDAVRLFFLHVQGSGRIKLDDGSIIRVGFSSKNNHEYVSIGKYMAEHGYIDKKTASKYAIEEWFRKHPDKILEILEKNPSYIFFNELIGDGPIGAQGAPLTPMRSIAVDKNFIPYGTPIWVDTSLNRGDLGKGVSHFHKLLIAQDTGSAIKGPSRMDIFFGRGAEAENLAGYQNSRGRYFILMPNGVN